MDRVPEPPPEADELYVLKRGEILGPFRAEALREAAARGDFTPQDFIQRGGTPIWQPLARWLDNEGAVMYGAVAPEWKSIVVWGARRLHNDIIEGSIVSGLVCTAIGAVTVFLIRWPAALWLPWFVLAVVAGVLAMRQGRVWRGLGLLLAVASVPVALSLFDRARPAPPASVASSAERAPDKPETGKAPAAPRPSFAPPAVTAPTEPFAIAQDPTPIPNAEPPPAPVAVAKDQPPLPLVPPPAAPLAVALPAAEPFPAARPPSSIPDFPPPRVGAMSETAPESGPPGDLVQRYHEALVVVKDNDSAGSGFICRTGGKARLFTNIHVLAGMKQPQFTELDGTRIKPGAAEAAVGHDVVQLALDSPPAIPLEALSSLESSVKIGDDIVVLGNSGGGGVVTKLEGKLLGIGPDRIEVSAEFIPGNSGSPIIHVATGRVIGIATYLTRRYEQFAGNSVVRRFGYRLDTVSKWEPVNWPVFKAEADRLEQISALTQDVFDFLAALRKKENPQFATETLRRPATEWLSVVRKSRASEADRLRATQSFLGNLRSLVRADVAGADTQVHYAYFREELRKEREVRDKLYKSFDDEARQLSLPSNRPGY
ncbi:MAG: serine protease Do [Chthoniobacter sp.]|jgi:S1-C subfamily serine protease|nr:serine protease Do [Chthoniobacter sp.]